MSELPIPADLLPMIRMAAAVCGAGLALLLFSLVVWTARDVAARSRDGMVRTGAVLLVLLLNVFGLIVYLLLRPRETIAEHYEREMIEELLAREISAGSIGRRAAARPPAPADLEGGA